MTLSSHPDCRRAAEAGFWRGLAAAHRKAHASGRDPALGLTAAREAIAEARRILSRARLGQDADVAVEARYGSTYAKARKLLRRGLKRGETEPLHEARKFVIHHLHQLKFLFPEADRRLAALETLRETLGDLNDLDELGQLPGAAEASAVDRRRIKRARGKLISRAEAQADKLFRRRSAPRHG